MLPLGKKKKPYHSQTRMLDGLLNSSELGDDGTKP
jgi:hypothetical protein